MALGVNVVFAESEEECKKKLLDLLKNDFKLIYVTEDYFDVLSAQVDELQDKYDATITFVPGGEKSLGCGAKLLEIYAQRATGSTACLK